MKKIVILLIATFCSGFIFGQNIDKTRERIQTLSSADFHGRGYTNKGGDIAAKYIANEMKAMGLKSFGKSYFQNFSYNVNTFPSNYSISIDGKEMIAGVDFITGPSTPTIKKDYEIYLPDSVELNDTMFYLTNYIIANDLDKKAFVIDYKQIKDREIKMFYIRAMLIDLKYGCFVELIPDELMASVRDSQQIRPVIKLKRESFDRNAKEISIDVKAKLVKNFKAKNVIGYIEGESDDFIVFTAHFDHIGEYGKNVCFYGAQDNASGVATVMDLADYYSTHKPKYNIAFMLFFGEEAGLLGSFNYVEHPFFDLNKIKMLVNLDMVGTGDDGITIVNSGEPEYETEWNLFNSINKENNYLPKIAQRGKAANSDHHPFNTKGVKAVFIYSMGGHTYYHNPKDICTTLTFTGYNGIFNLLTKFVERYE